MIDIIKRWLWPMQNKSNGHSPVAIPNPLNQYIYRCIRKPIAVRAVRWPYDMWQAKMWPDLLRGNLFQLETKLFQSNTAKLFALIPGGAWVIFCPDIERLWWIRDLEFGVLYDRKETITQPIYTTNLYSQNNATSFEVVQAMRKMEYVNAFPLRHISRDVVKTLHLNGVELRLDEGISLSKLEHKTNRSPNPDDWVVVVGNNAWAVEAAVFDALYKAVDEY